MEHSNERLDEREWLIERGEYRFHGFSCSFLSCWPELNDQSSRLPVICIHGFGAGAFHWKKNLPYLAAVGHPAWAIDLLGFGDSAMPRPGQVVVSDGFQVTYTFETWAEQILYFIDTVVLPQFEKQSTLGSPLRQVAIVANSIGCIAALQAAYQDCRHSGARQVRIGGVACLNPSLRLLHVKKRSWLKSLTTPIIIRLLTYRPLAERFFEIIRSPSVLRRILRTAYAVRDEENDVKNGITDHLIEDVRKPSLRQGALDVFLAFTAYDYGPLAEELIPAITTASSSSVPPEIWILWSENDPWEPVQIGEATLAHIQGTSRFMRIPHLGHCPQDQAPSAINPLLVEFLQAIRSLP